MTDRHNTPDQTFLVEWSMPLDAADPLDAAQQALGIHRDPGSIATVFLVSKGDKRWRVDATEDSVTPEAILPAAHRKVIDECVAEAWTNVDQNDALTEGDVAADIVRRLSRAYLGGE